MYPMDEDVYAPQMNFPTQPGENPETATEKKGLFSKAGDNFIDFIQSLVLFGAIFAIIYLFIAQPHKVSGHSMDDNFHDGDFIITEKISYRFGIPKHLDVIVFKNPRNESEDYIKRIIGLPGDTVRLSNNQIFVNGKLIDEPYLSKNTVTGGGSYLNDGDTVTVGPDQYLVFGDNRGHSSDSREWGTVKKELVKGKVFFRYWPIPKIGLTHQYPSD